MNAHLVRNPSPAVLALVLLLRAPSDAAVGTVTYSYDAAGRLAAADYGTGAIVAYSYDANGNLLSRTAGNGAETHRVIYTATAGGAIVGAATQTVAHGNSGSAVTAATNLYYRFAGWSDARPDNPRAETNVTADVSITARFAALLADLGTPHWWLAQYNLATGGITFAEAELGDTDADADPAWAEYVADTDPTVVTSRLRIVGIEPGPPLVVQFAPGSTGRTYALEFAGDLPGGGWTNVAGQGPRPGAGSPDAMTDTNAPPLRFYRIRVRLPDGT